LINSGSPVYLRSGNTTTSLLQIDEINVNGIWRSGAPIYTLDNGTLNALKVGSIRARLLYTDATFATTTTLGFAAATVNQLDINEINIQVGDGLGTLTSANIFRLNIPTTLSSPSRIGSVKLSTQDFAGVSGSQLVRLNNAINNWLKIDGSPTIRGDLSPPFIPDETSGQITRIFGSGAAPTQGSWKRGDIVFNQFPASGGFAGWVCTTAGTPGTWKTFGAISA
jgi:hypothetical protein